MDYIYAQGCSWTAGAELADGREFLSWPGTVTVGDAAREQSCFSWYLNERDREIRTRIDQRGYDYMLDLERQERNLAWPALLGNLTTTRVINAAQHGSSQEQITLQTRMDVLRMIQDGHRVRAMVQLTSPYRQLFPNLHTQNPPWVSIVAGNRYPENTPENLAQMAWASWPSTAHQLKWLNDVCNLVDFCECQGVTLHLIPGWSWEANTESFPQLWNRLRPYLVGENLDALLSNGERMPGGHPTATYHENLAEYLRQRFFSN